MHFNISQAREDGYTDNELATFLSQKHKFNYRQALSDGYGPAEIASFLSKKDFPAKKISL